MARNLRKQTAQMGVVELLEGSSWFGKISLSAREQVQNDISERALAAGASLGHYGETQHDWYGVLEGLLKWSIDGPDGRTVSLGGQSVGSWFGEGTLLRGIPRKANLIALRSTRVAQLPFETFDWLRLTEPAFNEFLLHQINERLHWFMGNYVAHRLGNADQLVARALLGLLHPLLNPRGQMRLLISQDELANLATVSRQRCNESLVTLRQEGIIRVEYGSIQILNHDALQKWMD